MTPKAAADRAALVLLAVWREVALHAELDACVPRIIEACASALPLDWLDLREFDVERRGLASRHASDRAASHFAAPRRDAAAEELEPWLEFCHRGRSEVLDGAARGGVGALVHARASAGAIVCCPLQGDAGPLGIALLGLAEGRAPSAAQLALLDALREPLAAALRNAARERELNARRESAEADRRSLLARLGRTEIAEAIVGADGGLREVMDRLALVAASDVPVLLLGETGSGKEVAARAIHNRSPRHERPFLRVNCGAIPAQLIDSELFGHERGSFTGATGTRAGWFERADTGTLFLDEIGELPLEAQVRLLRVLQDGTFERVGGQRSLRVDVRIVAATHRDLAAMIEREQFRRDLWYRIAVFPIHLPPLRDRREDLPALATHFALKSARRLGMPQLSPTREDLDWLASYAWPGNIRELASVMERAVLLGDGRRLAVAQALGVTAPALALPHARDAAAPRHDTTHHDARRAREATDAARVALGGAAHDAAKPAAHFAAVPAHAAAPTPRAASAISKAELEDALRRCFGRVEGPFGAAVQLGLNPNSLRSRLVRLRIDASAFRPRKKR